MSDYIGTLGIRAADTHPKLSIKSVCEYHIIHYSGYYGGQR